MFFATTVAELLLPPTSLALLALLIVAFWRRPAGRVAAALVLLVLLAASLPLVSQAALASLDPPPEASPESGERPGAIIILSAEVERTAEPDGADIGPLTLERERAGAALHRRTGLPVLVTGGVVTAPPPVAEQMARSLPADFGVPVEWVEPRSATTWENARFSAPMLRAAGIGRVYVVTHAWHMRRAVLAFRRAGLDPVPAVVRTDPWPRWTLSELLPRTSAWRSSYFAAHEWLGLLAYSLRR